MGALLFNQTFFLSPGINDVVVNVLVSTSLHQLGPTGLQRHELKRVLPCPSLLSKWTAPYRNNGNMRHGSVPYWRRGRDGFQSWQEATCLEEAAFESSFLGLRRGSSSPWEPQTADLSELFLWFLRVAEPERLCP